jgi:DNA-binding NarL/FixJ family response regulator
MKVLVVDDATSVRQRLLANFRKAVGVNEVAEAETGERALELLEEFKPDLVTLDLMLPGMSGLEVLEEIRDRDAKVKIVIFTNYPYPAFRRKCLALGATQFFGKSTDVERILEVIREPSEIAEPTGPGAEDAS